MCPELLGQGSRPSLPSAVVRRRTDEDPPALLPLPGGRARPAFLRVTTTQSGAITHRKLHKPITLVFQHK
jgi:hypothetical protein